MSVSFVLLAVKYIVKNNYAVFVNADSVPSTTNYLEIFLIQILPSNIEHG